MIPASVPSGPETDKDNAMNKVIDAASMNVPPSAGERTSLAQHDEADDFRCTPPVRYPLLVVISALILVTLFLCGLFA